MLRDATTHLFRPDSALYLHPAQVFGSAPFLAGFVRSATIRRYRSGLAALDLLNRETLQRYDELAADGIGRDIRADGYVSCFQNREVAVAAHRNAVTLARRGLTSGPGELLDGPALRTFEPALSQTARWGFVESGDRWTDPWPLGYAAVRPPHPGRHGYSGQDQTRSAITDKQPASG
jgi:D-amino-acid dehydrogenase